MPNRIDTHVDDLGGQPIIPRFPGCMPVSDIHIACGSLRGCLKSTGQQTKTKDEGPKWVPTDRWSFVLGLLSNSFSDVSPCQTRLEPVTQNLDPEPKTFLYI